MIKVPYEQILEKITKEGNISQEEVKEKIDAKMKQLSGLISKEGAAHIVANELGIKLLDQSPASGKLQINNIVPGLRNVETIGKVLQAYELREFNTNGREGKVASFLMGDETGTIRVVMWGDQAEKIKSINPGTITKVVGAYVRENNNYKELHINDKSKVIIDPPGESVQTEQKATERKEIGQLQENDANVEVLGTIVQVFDPRFFEVCPECSKRVKPEDDVFKCPAHNEVQPDYSYVMNVVIDDGSSNMRAVFFREAMDKLIKADKEKTLTFKDNPQAFEDVKTDLLGNLIKINGRVKRNMFFDRLEFMANTVSINPNPEEEMKRLDEEVQKAASE